MTGPNTDGCEQFGDYDEAEYNRQMMIAEIKVQSAAIEHLRANNKKLRAENERLTKEREELEKENDEVGRENDYLHNVLEESGDEPITAEWLKCRPESIEIQVDLVNIDVDGVWQIGMDEEGWVYLATEYGEELKLPAVRTQSDVRTLVRLLWGRGVQDKRAPVTRPPVCE